MQPKISIIVPIYGTEKYICQCVDSILAQTLLDIEIILIDDGSPDRCPYIVDNYAKKDKRIIAIHQVNSGYGRAINRGFEIATGKYIAIVESDDWIEATMYEKLYNNAEKNRSDVVKCSFFIYNSLSKKENKINRKWKMERADLFDAPNGAFTLRNFPQIVMFHASVWAGIYQNDFIRKNKILMIEHNKTMYQDFPFMCEVMSRANRISVVKDYLVHYRLEDGQNSSTKSQGRKGVKVIQMASRCIDGIEILKNNDALDIVKECIYFHAFNANIGFFFEIAWQFKTVYFDELYRLFIPLKNDYNFKFRYFNKKQIKFVHCIMNNDFIGAFTALEQYFSLKNMRRFMISFRCPYLSKKVNRWHLTLMGIQFGEQFYQRLAIIRIGK
jgi:glycosyltransferase involved in cell wall biosynthesis